MMCMLTDDLKQITGCVVGRVVLSSQSTRSKNAKDDEGDYATFTGPRDSVDEALSLLEQRVRHCRQCRDLW